MFTVGLTGGIGSGKSTVANLFASHGIPIIDADVIARELTLPSEPAFKTIAAHFGPTILAPDGTLDRSKLGEHIFKNPDERSWLESCLHPLILARIQQQLGLIQGVPYCIVVIPLLTESGSFPFIDRILVVDLPEEVQIDRVLNRDKREITQIKSILQTQASRQARMAIAHDVIMNEGSLGDLTTQVDALHKKYVSMAV